MADEQQKTGLRGLFVTFDGIDGSGKSTAIKKVARELVKRGYDVLLTREPTDSWLGDAVNRAIREQADPFVIAFAFMADRALHVNRIVKWLEEGKIVLCDRYVDSTYAYQAAHMEGFMEKPIEWLKAMHEPFALCPDITLLFDISPEDALARVQGREELIMFEKVEFLSKVGQNYLLLLEDNPVMARIDASKSITAVASDCLKKILERIQDNPE
ncbi:MAG: dTMP kinase [Thermoplasmata archaeon HGW-Thermoplasmata-1]|nr:MAG: dTMP kinase [Thermoplasmata archaeon HGW-Thermoplasmata-1]